MQGAKRSVSLLLLLASSWTGVIVAQPADSPPDSTAAQVAQNDATSSSPLHQRASVSPDQKTSTPEQSPGQARQPSSPPPTKETEKETEKGTTEEENEVGAEEEKEKASAERPGERITPPIPLNTPVEAVPDTEQHVEIVLELTIDKEGHVIEARATGGPEPFATRAVEATQAWSFKPATKGGDPKRARIAFLVTFDPPAEPPSESKEASPGAPSSPQARQPDERRVAQGTPRVRSTASAVPIQEVLVLGDFPDPGARGFSRYETRKIAGAFNDPLRTVEVLPGVVPILTGLPVYFIRGAPPGNVGYFLDGIRVPQLYHGFLGPSVLHPAFISKVNLHAGPMPARFGRFAGSAITADLAEPHGELRGEASLRLLDAGGFVEAPFAKGRGYAMVGGRYSYTALLFSLLSPEQRLDYWDYQALAGYRLGPRDEISLLTFGAYDYFGNDTGIQAGMEFHRVDLRYNHDFSDRAKGRLAFTVGRDRTRSELGFLRNNVFAARANFQLQREDVIVRAGADTIIDDYEMAVDPGVLEPEVYAELFPPHTDVQGGAYLELVLFPSGRVNIVPGIRTDIYSSLGDIAVGVDPRLSAEYQLSERLTATHTIGLAHQAPSFVPNVPGAQIAGLRDGLQETAQAATTYELALPWELSVSAGAFANVTTNLSDPVGASQTLGVDETSADQRLLGRAVGLELYLKRPLTRRLGALLSYTFSRSMRSTAFISTIAGYDRPHILNLALTYDFGAHFQASGKFVFASGVPGRRTTLRGFVFDGSRSIPLTRLDLKLAKRWYPSENFNWGAHIEVLNATYSPTVSRRTCGIRGCTDTGTAPIFIPSIGVDAAWN